MSYQISAFVTTVTNDVFTNLQIPNSQLTSSSWNKYVYQMHEAANVNHSTCTAMCAFEFDNGYESNCHFTVYDSNICYLGSLREETSILPTPVIADLDLKTCKCYEDIIKKWNFTCRHVFQMLCQMIELKASCFPIQPQVTKQSRSTFTKHWMLLALMMKHAHLCVTYTYLLLQSVISSFNMVAYVCWETLNLLEHILLLVMPLPLILMRVSWGQVLLEKLTTQLVNQGFCTIHLYLLPSMLWPTVNRTYGKIRFIMKNLPHQRTIVLPFAE